MAVVTQSGERRTSVDAIFDFLRDEITSLRLRPGDKISEAEIAARFGVSRQPVRDAFSRLANIDLLLIRPQRATEVKCFSRREVTKARFVRAAIETEVLRRAAAHCDAVGAVQLADAIEAQERCVREDGGRGFVDLDYAFHKELCIIAQAEFAFDVILAEKAKVDRLCTLSLSHSDRLPELVEDHRAIASAVVAHDEAAAVAAGVRHLSRLDETIEQISATNANYFADDDI